MLICFSKPSEHRLCLILTVYIQPVYYIIHSILYTPNLKGIYCILYVTCHPSNRSVIYSILPAIYPGCIGARIAHYMSSVIYNIYSIVYTLNLQGYFTVYYITCHPSNRSVITWYVYIPIYIICHRFNGSVIYIILCVLNTPSLQKYILYIIRHLSSFQYVSYSLYTLHAIYHGCVCVGAYTACCYPSAFYIYETELTSKIKNVIHHRVNNAELHDEQFKNS